VASALGWWAVGTTPVGCEIGRRIYFETKRAAYVVNAHRRARPLRPTTVERLQPLFPDVPIAGVRVRDRCRLPANRFLETGSIHAMAFGSTLFFRDELDEDRPTDLVRLIHELVHVSQVHRLGGEREFACAYGRGYVDGGGELPAYLGVRGAYHHNPMEAEAYRFEARFRDDDGRIRVEALPAAVG
jgi:hypothetical protein